MLTKIFNYMFRNTLQNPISTKLIATNEQALLKTPCKYAKGKYVTTSLACNTSSKQTSQRNCVNVKLSMDHIRVQFYDDIINLHWKCVINFSNHSDVIDVVGLILLFFLFGFYFGNWYRQRFSNKTIRDETNKTNPTKQKQKHALKYAVAAWHFLLLPRIISVGRHLKCVETFVCSRP